MKIPLKIRRSPIFLAINPCKSPSNPQQTSTFPIFQVTQSYKWPWTQHFAHFSTQTWRLITRPLLTWPLLLRDLRKSAQCCFWKSWRRSAQSWSGLWNWCLALWSQSPRNKNAWYRKQDDFRRTTWCSSLPASRASSASRSCSCKTALQMFGEGSRVNAFWFAMAPESVRVDGWSAALLVKR